MIRIRKLVVSDGELLWIYDMDLEQVTIRGHGPASTAKHRPCCSAVKPTPSKANFNVSADNQDGQRIYHLQPLDNSQLFEELRFAYQGEQTGAHGNFSMPLASARKFASSK